MTPIERYLEHLDNIFQTEPDFFVEQSLDERFPGVSNIVYADIPEKGMITVVTYGLSVVSHPDWKFGRPELCMSVESDNESWKHVVGYMANSLRGDCPFLYGQTIDFKDQIAADSAMDAFLVFAPSIFEDDDYLNVDVGLDYKINIAGLYPIYASEIEKIDELGLEAFWKHPGFDMYNVKRERIK